MVVTLSRPEVMNALHPPANFELDGVFNAFFSDPDLWVAIVTGEGDRAFCTGSDLKYNGPDKGRGMPPGGFAGMTARVDMLKPVIAAVNGLAVGGGFELALACDLVVADERSAFALLEPRMGFAAMEGGLQRLTRQIPWKAAMGLILTGRTIGAQEAFSLHIVNEVAPVGQSLARARYWADEILKCSPLAIRASLEAVHTGAASPSLGEALQRQKAGAQVRSLWTSADRAEGRSAFLERRPPRWTGR